MSIDTISISLERALKWNDATNWAKEHGQALIELAKEAGVLRTQNAKLLAMKSLVPNLFWDDEGRAFSTAEQVVSCHSYGQIVAVNFGCELGTSFHARLRAADPFHSEDWMVECSTAEEAHALLDEELSRRSLSLS